MIKFEFETPMPFLNTQSNGGYFFVQYPSGQVYWRIENEDGKILKEGSYVFPKETLDIWLESDDVLIEKILEDKPWNF